MTISSRGRRRRSECPAAGRKWAHPGVAANLRVLPPAAPVQTAKTRPFRTDPRRWEPHRLVLALAEDLQVAGNRLWRSGKPGRARDSPCTDLKRDIARPAAPARWHQASSRRASSSSSSSASSTPSRQRTSWSRLTSRPGCSIFQNSSRTVAQWRVQTRAMLGAPAMFRGGRHGTPHPRSSGTLSVAGSWSAPARSGYCCRQIDDLNVVSSTSTHPT